MRSFPRPAAEADRADRFVRAIAQGASEHNISVVIDGRSSGSCTKMCRSPSTMSTDWANGG
jgi:hypothetical protein